MKSKVGLILTWSILFVGVIGFILFGNKEGRFKYYEDGLSVTVQNQTNQLLTLTVSELVEEQVLFVMEVAPHSTSSVTKPEMLPQTGDQSLLIDYDISGETRRLEGFPYIGSLENKYVLQLEFTENGQIFVSGLNGGQVFSRNNFSN